MITVESRVRVGKNKYQTDFNGLSTDTKPTGSYEGSEIANGSTFMELDTHKVAFYDEEGEAWH